VSSEDVILGNKVQRLMRRVNTAYCLSFVRGPGAMPAGDRKVKQTESVDHMCCRNAAGREMSRAYEVSSRCNCQSGEVDVCV
jgi:hypothetical protein